MVRAYVMAVLMFGVSAAWGAGKKSDGAALFKAHCSVCHGSAGEGSAQGKALGVKPLKGRAITAEEIAALVRKGKGQMREWHEWELTPEQVTAVSRFTQSLTASR